ncbi:MAG: LytTR family DNA-binding domain-containing protein [Methanocorpusculum sp.]|jgi:two-component system LytT family response regulator|nr:LytTR family DNA-binding domain-containing protein [Methanocorpusculum sp.]MDD3270936.1 LytTR family DNA-binding domain-containing protein [Syntrophomonadaceae bacterium]MDD4562238.1 LytTR family DNA-binding domain-containing protein [Syntrophomonadaceae bacterium]
MKGPMNVLLLEDDVYTREFFTMLLYDIPGITNVLVTPDGKEAINLARYQCPDLILLDIELVNDDLNGMEVAKQIYSFNQEAYLVFVTAHSQYAISSFAVHPYNYILKPIVIEEFKAVIQEIADKVKIKDMQSDCMMVVPFGHKKDFILKDEIAFIEVQGKQSIINAESGQWITYKPLNELEKQLDHNFIRVHRSFIVNLEHVKSIKEVYDRTYEIELRHYSQKIPMSRTAYNKYKHRFN